MSAVVYRERVPPLGDPACDPACDLVVVTDHPPPVSLEAYQGGRVAIVILRKSAPLEELAAEASETRRSDVRSMVLRWAFLGYARLWYLPEAGKI